MDATATARYDTARGSATTGAFPDVDLCTSEEL
jgi:hypothetical protein